MMYEKEVKEKVTAILPQVVTWRRHFHEYPELSGKEVKTSAYIQDVFKNLGIPYETGFFQNAVLGIIKGSHPGKTVALRADMDALPVTELTGLPFASKNEGVMHACGHDGHMSILLGAAAVLNEMKDQIHGTVKIVSSRPRRKRPSAAAAILQPAGNWTMYQKFTAFMYGRSFPRARWD